MSGSGSPSRNRKHSVAPTAARSCWLPPLPQFGPSATGNAWRHARYGRNILAGFLLPTLARSAGGPGQQHLEAHAAAAACWIKGRLNSNPSKIKASRAPSAAARRPEPSKLPQTS